MTYGQTGSGKTFTMTGDSGNYQVEDSLGCGVLTVYVVFP